jgi:hypothetical protein
MRPRGRQEVIGMEWELTEADMAEVQRDLDQLIRMGLVVVSSNGGLVLIEAGIDAINKTNGQTWN